MYVLFWDRLRSNTSSLHLPRHVISFETEETNVRWKRISVFPLIKLQLYERCLCK
jgi:hypothetical protein